MSSGRTFAEAKRRRWWLLEAAACLWCAACASTAPAAPAAAPQPLSPPVEFSFPPDGDHVVSSETTRGRATVLAFIATYDLASQLVVRRLSELVVRFTPRSNAAAVVMEPPLYAELLPAYRESMGAPFPIVMADFATQNGRGPFGNIDRVPTVIVLDRAGREVWRAQGQVEGAAVERALRRAVARN